MFGNKTRNEHFSECIYSKEDELEETKVVEWNEKQVCIWLIDSNKSRTDPYAITAAPQL